MNNQIIIQRKELHDKLINLKKQEKQLTNFLERSEDCFQKDESINALLNIKNYLSNIQEEKELTEKQIFKLFADLFKNICNHEIIFEDENNIACAICTRPFLEKNLSFNHFLIKTTEDDRIRDPLAGININHVVLEIIEKIAEEDKDIFEVFEQYFNDARKPLNTKIYRRIK